MNDAGEYKCQVENTNPKLEQVISKVIKCQLAFAKSCILKVSQDFKTFLRSLARLSRLSRLLKPERYTMNIV